MWKCPPGWVDHASSQMTVLVPWGRITKIAVDRIRRTNNAIKCTTHLGLALLVKCTSAKGSNSTIPYPVSMHTPGPQDTFILATSVRKVASCTHKHHYLGFSAGIVLTGRT